MLTHEERIEMYKGKKLFIDNVSKVFEIASLQSNVAKVSYEVYMKQIDDETMYYSEFVVVTFQGGGKSVRIISGNSNNATFREIGKLIDGGYYDELEYYNKIRTTYTKVELEEIK